MRLALQQACVFLSMFLQCCVKLQSLSVVMTLRVGEADCLEGGGEKRARCWCSGARRPPSSSLPETGPGHTSPGPPGEQ
jgi:hypothetical protein